MQITNAADRIAARLEAKRARRPWNPDLHPRDSKGRFIETGGIARLWGGGMARVLRALGGRQVLVENLSTREQSNVHASRLTMVARPDGTAPTRSKRKVRDEDERRQADGRRGTGQDAEDGGDQGDTPDEPHDQDDEGNPVGDDVEGEDHGAGPEPEDDEPEEEKPAPKRPRRDPKRRFKTLEDVRAHWAGGQLRAFTENQQAQEAHNKQMVELIDKLDKPQLSRNGHFVIGHMTIQKDGKDVPGWAVIHTDTGLRLTMADRKAEATDFANRMESAQLDGKPIDWNDPASFDQLDSPEGRAMGGRIAHEAREAFSQRAAKKREGATARTKPAPAATPEQQAAQQIASRSGAPAPNVAVGHVGPKAPTGDERGRPRNDAELRELWKQGGDPSVPEGQRQVMRRYADDPNVLHLAGHRGFAIVEDTSRDDEFRFTVLTSGSGRRLSGLGAHRLGRYGNFADQQTADRFALYLGSNLRDENGRTLDWGSPDVAEELATFRDKDGQPSNVAIWLLAGQFDRERGVNDSQAARFGRPAPAASAEEHRDGPASPGISRPGDDVTTPQPAAGQQRDNQEEQSERVHGAGEGVLGDVPADGAGRAGGDDAEGDVLRADQRGDRASDRGVPGRLPAGDGAGDGLPGGDGPGEHGDDSGAGAGPARDGVQPGEGGGHRGSGDAAGEPSEDRSRVGFGSREQEQTAPQFQPPEDGRSLVPSGVAARVKANIAAIEVLRRLEAENRPATAAEQETLARWSGWGATPQVFVPNPKPEFEPLQKKLRALLTEEEWEAAEGNTLNAHYTDPSMVQAVWKAVRELGFNGGNVLEPGSGSGNFIGHAPEGAHMTGVELDPITAGIAKALYPQANIRNEGFEKTRAADGTFDLAIGNVPFGDYQVVDLRHNKGGHNIHNHFILKSLDLTRPGGLVAVVTSRYTMDGSTPRAEDARMEMARKADLVGAVRLPTGAHRRTAGTDVVTDLLIFRRREKDKDFTSGRTRNGQVKPVEERKKDDPPVWVHSIKVDDLPGQPEDEAEKLLAPEVHLNPYFLDNPQNVLGEMEVGHGMYGPGELRVVGDGDLDGSLAKALTKAVTRAKDAGLSYTPDTGERRKVELLPEGSNRIDGHVEVAPDGTFTQVRDGMIRPYDVPSTQVEEARQLVGLRDSFKALVAEESRANADDQLIETLRGDLKVRYDKYHAKFGSLNRFDWATRKATDPETGAAVEKAYRKRPPMGGLLTKDPTMAVILSLDSYDANTKTSTPAAIFTKRQAKHRAIAERASSPEDAMAIVLEQHSTLDGEALGKVMGLSPAAAREKLLAARSVDPETGHEYPLVFEPHNGGHLIPAADYLSGNVRARLAEAQALAGEDARFEINVRQLEAVLPPDISPGEIDAPMGASWLGAKPVQMFLREKLGTDLVTVSYQGGSLWKVDAPDGIRKGRAANHVWGVPGFNAVKLVETILTNGRIRVVEKDADGKSYLDEEATAAAQAKAEELREEFQDWLWATPERADIIKRAYNNTHNNLALRSYDGQRRSMPGLAEWFKPHPHQHAAVARMVNEPAVLLAHEVGAGKTAEMTMGVMELRRLGLINKAAMVVPNHMLQQFTDEFAELYPESAANGRILSASSEDLQGRKRREFIARVATGDYDAVILTQNAFESIPMRPEVQLEYIKREAKALKRALERQKEQDQADEPGSRRDSRMVKEIQARLKKLKAKIESKIAASKDMAGLYFEDTGIDYVVVDEAHHYKNLSTNSGIPGAGIEGSNRASDLDMKLEYLRKSTKSGRVVTFATATPISNSVTEAHTMLRYLRPDLLEAARVRDFDEFASTYGKIVSGVELAADGSGFKEVSRFAAFRNMPELLRIWKTVADVKNSDDLAEYLDTPEVSGGKAITVSVEPTAQMLAYQEQLAARARAVKGGDVDPRVDNMLKISSDGRKVSLDPRMVGLDEAGLKLSTAADNISRIYENTKDAVYPTSKNNPTPHDTPGGLQIVFLDMGTPKDPGKTKKKGKKGGDSPTSLDELAESPFPAYQELKELLIERGVPADKVRFIHEAKNDAEKARLFHDARTGKIAVLVGSTTKMGTGTNVQLRATALHHLDCPWRPADLEQRNGRIIRQGNMNPSVAIFQYVTEQSFDGFSWQTVARKAKFIRQLMKGNLTDRTVEDIPDGVFNAEQVTAISTGNPHLLEQANVKATLAILSRKLKGHTRTIEGYKSTIQATERLRKATNEMVAKLEDVMKRRKNTRGDDFNATIGNSDFTKRDEASKALATAALAVMRRGQNDGRSSGPATIIGKVGGIEVTATYRMAWDNSGRVHLVDISIPDIPQSRHSYTETDLKLESNLRITRLEDSLAGIEQKIVRAQSHLRQEERAAATARERVDRPFEHAAELEAAERRSKLVSALIREQSRQVGPDAGKEKQARLEELEHQLREARIAAGEESGDVDDPAAAQDTDLLPRTPAPPSISTDAKGRPRILWPDSEAKKAAKEREKREKVRRAREERGETVLDPEEVQNDLASLRDEEQTAADSQENSAPTAAADAPNTGDVVRHSDRKDATEDDLTEAVVVDPSPNGPDSDTVLVQDLDGDDEPYEVNTNDIRENAGPSADPRHRSASADESSTREGEKVTLDAERVHGDLAGLRGDGEQEAPDEETPEVGEAPITLEPAQVRSQLDDLNPGTSADSDETDAPAAEETSEPEVTRTPETESSNPEPEATALPETSAPEADVKEPDADADEPDTGDTGTSTDSAAAEPDTEPAAGDTANNAQEGTAATGAAPRVRTSDSSNSSPSAATRQRRPAGTRERGTPPARPAAPQPEPADMTSEQLANTIDDLQDQLAPLSESTDPQDLAVRRRMERRLWELEDEERRRWKPEPRYDADGKLIVPSRGDVVRDRLAGYGLNDAEVQGLVSRVEDLPEAKEGGYSDEEWERISADASAREAYPPTDEQNIIIEGAARRGLNMAVMALAGTGKSSTLKMLSHRMPGKKIVYLAFNRSVAAEAREAQARGEYAKNMLASTANAYAARVADRRLNDRLPSNRAGGFKKLNAQQIADRMRWYDTVRAGNRDLSPGGAATVAERMIREWAKSADAEMGPQHVRAKTDEERRDLFNAVKPLADRMWANLTDTEAGDPDRDLAMDFDYIVKQWALGGYKIDADTLFWDEAQDVNPVMEGVVRAALDQGVQVVAVGDSNQAIYGFRGASDALAKLPVDARATLTQSFRFGPAVAEVGNRFLRLLGTRMRLKGFDRKQSHIAQLQPGEESMVIARTNAGVALAAVQALTVGRTVAVSGGVKALQEFVQAAHALAAGEDTDHAELARFNGMPYDDILEEVKADPDLQQLASLFNLLEKHGDDIDALLASGSRPAATELVGDRVWVRLDWNDAKSGDLKRWLGDGKNNGVGKLLYDPTTRRYYYEPGKRDVPWKTKTRSGIHKIDNKLSLEEAQKRIDAHLAKLYPQDTTEDGGGRLVAESEPHDVLVTTAHKAKGLESERVRIADDFKGPEDDDSGNIDWDTLPDDEALRVAYVAVTRATEVLDPGSLGWVFRAVNDDDPTQPPKGEYRRDFTLSDFTVGDQIDFEEEDGTPNIGVVSEINAPLLTVLSDSAEPGMGAKRQEIGPSQVQRRNGEPRPLLPIAEDGQQPEPVPDADTSTPQSDSEQAPREEDSGPLAAGDHVMTADGPGEVVGTKDDAILVRTETSTGVHGINTLTRLDGSPIVVADQGDRERRNQEQLAQAATPEGLELDHGGQGHRLRDLDVAAGHGTIVDRDGNTIGWVRARIGDDGRRYWWGQDADGGAPADMQWHEEMPAQAGVPAVRAAGIVRDGLDFLRAKFTDTYDENGAPEQETRSLRTPDRAITEMTLTPAQVRELSKLSLSGTYADGKPIDTLPWDPGHRRYSPYSAQAGAIAAAARSAAAEQDLDTPAGRRNKKVLLGAARKMEFQQYDSARRAASIPPPGQPDEYDKPYVPRPEEDDDVDADQPENVSGPSEQGGPAAPEASRDSTDQDAVPGNAEPAIDDVEDSEVLDPEQVSEGDYVRAETQNTAGNAVIREGFLLADPKKVKASRDGQRINAWRLYIGQEGEQPSARNAVTILLDEKVERLPAPLPDPEALDHGDDTEQHTNTLGWKGPDEQREKVADHDGKPLEVGELHVRHNKTERVVYLDGAPIGLLQGANGYWSAYLFDGGHVGTGFFGYHGTGWNEGRYEPNDPTKDAALAIAEAHEGEPPNIRSLFSDRQLPQAEAEQIMAAHLDPRLRRRWLVDDPHRGRAGVLVDNNLAGEIRGKRGHWQIVGQDGKPGGTVYPTTEAAAQALAKDSPLLDVPPSPSFHIPDYPREVREADLKDSIESSERWLRDHAPKLPDNAGTPRAVRRYVEAMKQHLQDREDLRARDAERLGGAEGIRALVARAELQPLDRPYRGPGSEEFLVMVDGQRAGTVHQFGGIWQANRGPDFYDRDQAIAHLVATHDEREPDNTNQPAPEPARNESADDEQRGRDSQEGNRGNGGDGGDEPPLASEAAAPAATPSPRAKADNLTTPQDANPTPAAIPERVGGRRAEWVKVSDLTIGDLVRIDGITKQGRAVTRAGYVVDGPKQIDTTRSGRVQGMYRVLISDTADGRNGKRESVWISLDATAARATRDDADRTEGAPETGADSDVRTGRVAERVATDPNGNGLFPGSTVTDDNGREGVVTGVTASNANVQFGDDRTDDAHAPTTLNVTDGGAARPAGWTADGHLVRLGNVVGDLNGRRLGTVEGVDGDTVTIATPQGMEDRSAADLRVMGGVEVPDNGPSAKVGSLKRVSVRDLAEGDPILVDGPGGMTTAKVTGKETISDTHIRITAVDTTTGEQYHLDGGPDTTYLRPLDAEGRPVILGPEDAPDNQGELRIHEPAPVVDPVTGPTVDPQLSPEERDAIADRGAAPTGSPDAQQAAARIANDQPLTTDQAEALASDLREGADSSTTEGRAAQRAADHLDAAAGNDVDESGQPEAGTVDSVGVGDTITLPGEFDPDTMTAFRVVHVQDVAGGMRALTIEDQDGMRFKRVLAADDPLYQLPEPEAPADEPDAEPRDPNPAPDVNRLRADYADAVTRAVVDSAVEGTSTPGSIHQLREQIAQQLTPKGLRAAMRRARNGALAAITDAGIEEDERDALVHSLRPEGARARTDTIRAALRTVNDLEPLDGESEEDTARRAADLLRLIPDALRNRPESSDPTDGETDVNNAVTRHANDAVSEALEAAANSGPLTEARRAAIVAQLAERMAATRNAAAERIAANVPAGRRPGAFAQIVAALLMLAQKIIALVTAFLKGLAKLWRHGRTALRNMRERIARFRSGLMQRMRSWPEARRLRRLAAAADLPEHADGLPLGDRVAHWARLLPAPGRFGQVSRRARWYQPATRSSLATGQLPPVQDGVRWTMDRAVDGGPGPQALRHLAAVRAAGQDVDTDVAARLSAAAPELGDDPHGTVRHASDHADTAERRLRDLEAAAAGGAPDADLEIAAARVEAQFARQEAGRLQRAYAAALPGAVRDSIAEVREVGPGTSATLITTPDSAPDAVRALTGVAQFVPRDWLLPTEARFLGARTGDQGAYDPASRIATVAALGDGGQRAAAHALLQHLQQHYPDLLAAQEAFHFTRTHSGRTGARRRTGLDLLLARLFRGRTEQAGNGDLVPLGLATLFSGDWYEDDDLRAFLLGLLATR
ncbi:UvrD-helicase domain-containing protein [Streptomyces virginiae]|uniref:UvrD-helicase domain-containing protein n=1 Tax=Streptomyces virginiae TaxID=1961 RepID=UPI00364A9218